MIKRFDAVWVWPNYGFDCVSGPYEDDSYICRVAAESKAQAKVRAIRKMRKSYPRGFGSDMNPFFGLKLYPRPQTRADWEQIAHEAREADKYEECYQNDWGI